MKFVIDRSKWRCGGDSGDNKIGKGETELLNKQGFMCCLGQISCQLGLKKKEILNVAEPDGLRKHVSVLNIINESWGVEDYKNTRLAQQAIKINDDDSLTTKERERKLKSLFSKFHHTLVFKGKPVVKKET